MYVLALFCIIYYSIDIHLIHTYNYVHNKVYKLITSLYINVLITFTFPN